MGEETGEIPMKCEVCGNTDLNKMIVHYVHIAANKMIMGGTTTLPKFLYETMHPEEPKIRGATRSLLIDPRQLVALRITRITCDKCLMEGRGSVEIKPTKHGI